MSRMFPQSAVGVALNRAVLCPNDETVYDAEQWIVCPTCDNEEGLPLARILGGMGPGRAPAPGAPADGRAAGGEARGFAPIRIRVARAAEA